MARRLPFDAEVIICTGREMSRMMAQNYFAGQTARPDIVRFVSILSRKSRLGPSAPMSIPSGGEWVLKILARQGRFVVGVYRRYMRAINHLGTLDRLFGVPVTTRNWSTITAIGRVLGDEGRSA